MEATETVKLHEIPDNLKAVILALRVKTSVILYNRVNFTEKARYMVSIPVGHRKLVEHLCSRFNVIVEHIAVQGNVGRHWPRDMFYLWGDKYESRSDRASGD